MDENLILIRETPTGEVEEFDEETKKWVEMKYVRITPQIEQMMKNLKEE